MQTLAPEKTDSNVQRTDDETRKKISDREKMNVEFNSKEQRISNDAVKTVRPAPLDRTRPCRPVRKPLWRCAKETSRALPDARVKRPSFTIESKVVRKKKRQ